MNTPAEWAMQAARGIVAKRFSVTPKVAAIVVSGGMDGEEPDIAAIARAIEAADKAATERAACIADKEMETMERLALEHPEDSAQRDRCLARARSCLAIATAIRKGGVND